MRKWRVVILLWVVACGGSGHNPTLDQAHEVHLEAIGLYDGAHRLYDSLRSDAGAKGNTLLVSRLDSIHEVMHEWAEALYEIPGYAHAHSDSHDHGHAHKTVPKMTDQSMLDYQQDARRAISEIKRDLEKLAGRP